VVEKWPLVLLSIASGIMTLVAQHGGGAIQSLEASPLDQRVSNALVAVVRYLEKTVRFDELAVWYPRQDWPAWQVIGAAALLATITVGAWFTRRRRPALLVGWLFFLVALAPMIGIIQVGAQSMADRYSYLPHLGLLMMLIGAAPIRAAPAMIVGAVLLAPLAGFTWRQSTIWRDSESLYLHAIAVTRENPFAENNLGEHLERNGDLAGALARYERASALRPHRADYHFNVANVLRRRGDWTGAVARYEQAVQREPDHVPALHNLGVALLKLGRIDSAMPVLQRALRGDPSDFTARLNIGEIHMVRGQYQQAIDHFRKVAEQSPDFPRVHLLLGACLARVGQPGAAAEHLRRELTLRPDDAEARRLLDEVEAALKGGRP
jgi:Flp pilus assembly protein TadD